MDSECKNETQNTQKRITNKKMLNEWLDYELARYNKTRRSINIAMFREKDIICAFLSALRKTEYHINTNHKIRKIIYKLRLSRLTNKYCLRIPPNVCGKGLKLLHVGPILVNGYSSIGEDCTLHINTSVVAGGVDKGFPILKDGVVLGVGSVVVGGVTLAKNIAVGANAVVTKSFSEENIAIAGAPARKVSDNGRLAWNKSNKK